MFATPRVCLSMLALGLTWLAKAQVFVNHAPDWGITQQNWDGVYGAAVSTADWNNDGWPDITFGNTQGALRTFRNLQGNGFMVLALPWVMESETKALLWTDLDNDGDDDFFIQEASGVVGCCATTVSATSPTSPKRPACLRTKRKVLGPPSATWTTTGTWICTCAGMWRFDDASSNGF